MALSNFYIQSGGNNANAGSDTNNAASVTVTNGAWSTVTNIFTGVTGTEFAGTVVGDWASIYVDGATVAVFLAQITAVGALGVSITVSATIKFGTAPTTSATTRSCKVGGAHASELPWASGGIGATTAPVSTIVNWKQATYTIVASRTFNCLGTAVLPLIFQGYNSTPGDCNADPTQARPVISQNATFVWTNSGNFQQWLNFNITGSRTGTTWSVTSSSGIFFRVRSENTSSNAGAIGMQTATSNSMFFYCWFKAPTTATTSGCVSNGVTTQYFGCVFEGGGIAGINCAATGPTLAYCIFLNNTGVCMLFSTGRASALNCTFYNPTSDAIKWTGAPSTVSFVINCLFSTVGGVAINNASGTNSSTVTRMNNDYHSITGGADVGMGDNPAYFGQTESATPFISAPTNLGIKTTSNAFAHGFATPGAFENLASTISYNDIGAVQAQASAAAAGYVPQIME